MPDQQLLPSVSNHETAEVLVKEPDGTFHTVNVPVAQILSQTPSVPTMPRLNVQPLQPLATFLEKHEEQELAHFMQKTQNLVSQVGTERTPMQSTTRPPSEKKSIVQDVSFTPTLSGPIDTLRCSIDDWRRLASSVTERSKKILGKLQLLEEESYSQRVKGIAAWYGSAVVQAYQAIGRAGITQGKTIAVICTEGQSADNRSLTEEEFLSIAALNEQLRF